MPSRPHRWHPVGVTTVARALLKVWNDTGRIVDPVDYQLYTWAERSALWPEDGALAITTPRLRFRVPEVISLMPYDRVPVRQVPFSRRNVFKRDRYTCQYCGVRPGSAELTIDHVVPRAQGGVSRWDNCVLACVACNTRKANRTPQQAGMWLRQEPVRPAWQPLYALGNVRIESWARFLNVAYWHGVLEA